MEKALRRSCGHVQKERKAIVKTTQKRNISKNYVIPVSMHKELKESKYKRLPNLKRTGKTGKSRERTENKLKTIIIKESVNDLLRQYYSQ
jgi:hypothetical protein